MIIYFENDDLFNIKGMIDCNDILNIVKDSSNRSKFYLYIFTTSRVYSLEAFNFDDYNKWFQIISNFILSKKTMN
jgi:hypothetical protein